MLNTFLAFIIGHYSEISKVCYQFYFKKFSGEKMKKEIICKKCTQVSDRIIVCDQCGIESTFTSIELIGSPNSSTNYFEILGEYDFCSLECLLDFVLAEYKKLNSAKNLITGKKEKK
jgi:hypothetical protein